MALAQAVKKPMAVRIAWTERERLFKVGQRRLGLSQCLQCEAKLNHRTRKIAVQRDCLLKMDLRFDRSTLKPAKPSDCKKCPRVVAVALEGVEEQLLSACLILLT